jgi:branched-chain amino acid transport system substrate-binding protein
MASRSTWEECETEYNNAKGVECYERLKAKAKVSTGPLHTMSTGISYALVDKATEDKLPLAMMGYGRTDAVDGSVFPYAFPLVTTYQMQASAIRQVHQGKGKRRQPGREEDRVISITTPLTARKPIVALHGSRSQAEQIRAGPDPGGASRATSKARNGCRSGRRSPNYVIFWGWGVMNQTAFKAAQKVGYAREQDDRFMVGRLRGRHRAGGRRRQGLHGCNLERGRQGRCR